MEICVNGQCLIMLMQVLKKSHEYLVTSYGADPTGNSDSTEALLEAMADAAKGPSKGFLMNGIIDLGGAQINLQGGDYLISKPLQFPMAGVGNLMVYSKNHFDNFFYSITIFTL